MPTDIYGKKNPFNVIFVAIDDLNDWITSLDGHPQTVTPNFDREDYNDILRPDCNPIFSKIPGEAFGEINASNLHAEVTQA